MFKESWEELVEVGRDPLVECLGLTFEDEDAQHAHLLTEFRKGLEEMHEKLGGIPFAGIDDAAARMAAVEHWPGRWAMPRVFGASPNTWRRPDGPKTCCDAGREGWGWVFPRRDRGAS